MKTFRYFLLFLLFAALFTLPVSAGMTEDLKNFSDFDILRESLPEGITEEDANLFLEESEDVENKVLEKVVSYVSFSLKENLGLFASLTVLLLISAGFSAVKKSFGAKTESAFDFLFLTSSSLLTFKALADTVETARNAMLSANAFLLSTAPVSTVLLTLSGSPNSAATGSAFLGFTVTLVSTFFTYFLMPLVQSLFCFAVIEGVGEKMIYTPLSFLKNLVKRLILFFFTVISATLAIKNALAASADSVAMRSVRFAAGSFIPVVGSLVGENTRLLSGTFQLVKTECGVFCLTVLLLLLVPPILTVFVQKSFFLLASGVGGILGETRLSRFLHSLSGILDLVSALLVTNSIFFIFVTGLFLQTKGGL